MCCSANSRLKYYVVDGQLVLILYTRYNTLDTYCRELQKRKRTKVFIAKPPSGAMGIG